MDRDQSDCIEVKVESISQAQTEAAEQRMAEEVEAASASQSLRLQRLHRARQSVPDKSNNNESHQAAFHDANIEGRLAPMIPIPKDRKTKMQKIRGRQ